MMTHYTQLIKRSAGTWGTVVVHKLYTSCSIFDHTYKSNTSLPKVAECVITALTCHWEFDWPKNSMSAMPHKSGLRSAQMCYGEMLKSGKVLIFFLLHVSRWWGFNGPSLCHRMQLLCFTHRSLPRLYSSWLRIGWPAWLRLTLSSCWPPLVVCYCSHS